MHHVPMLINIGLALGYALLGGLVARKLGLPTIVHVATLVTTIWRHAIPSSGRRGRAWALE